MEGMLFLCSVTGIHYTRFSYTVKIPDQETMLLIRDDFFLHLKDLRSKSDSSQSQLSKALIAGLILPNLFLYRCLSVPFSL